MDLDGPIDFQRKLLLREIVWLFTWLKIEPGGSVENMSRFVANSIRFVLRPAESGLRRLLVIEAQKLKGKVALRVRKSSGAAQKRTSRIKVMCAARIPQFPLFDKPIKACVEKPPQRKPQPQPRITVLDIGMSPIEQHIWRMQQRALPKPKYKPVPPRNAPPNAARLCRRLSALHDALLDVPKQAERMARALARREMMPAEKRGEGPLRHGHPPGHRQRVKHPIDTILRDCVLLERSAAWEAFDTS